MINTVTNAVVYIVVWVILMLVSARAVCPSLFYYYYLLPGYNKVKTTKSNYHSPIDLQTSYTSIYADQLTSLDKSPGWVNIVTLMNFISFFLIIFYSGNIDSRSGSDFISD